MNRPSFARTVTAAVAAILLLACASTATALEKIQFTDTKTFDVGNELELDISTISGNISYTVGGGTEATVEIVIDVRAADEDEAQQIRELIEINVEGAQGMLEASVEYPDDFSRDLRREFGKKRSISVSFLITGPEDASGHLGSVSGDALVDGLTGPVEISTVSGDVIAKRVERRLSAGSVSGNVDVSDCGNRVSTNSVSGSIHVESCGGDVKAGTVSGDIDLTGIGGDVSVNTTSGNVDAEHKNGDMTIETVSGNVRAQSASSAGEIDVESVSGSVELFADTDNIGRIALSTFSGDIHMKNDPTNKKKSRRGFNGRGDLHLTLGNGDLDVRANTHSGDIWVREL